MVMQAANPFYINMGADNIASGISALGEGFGKFQANKQAQAKEAQDKQEYQTDFTTAWQAHQSGDSTALPSFYAKYPDRGDQLASMIGYQDKQQQKGLRDFTRKFMTANPADRERLILERRNTLQSQGADITQTQDFYNEYIEDPESAMNNMEMIWAGVDPNAYTTWKENNKKAEPQIKEHGGVLWAIYPDGTKKKLLDKVDGDNDFQVHDGHYYDPADGTWKPVAAPIDAGVSGNLTAQFESLNESYGLSEDEAAAAMQAYTLAGGGKDGLKAYEVSAKNAQAATKMKPENLKTYIDNQWPSASDEEKAQILTAMQGAGDPKAAATKGAEIFKNQGIQRKAYQRLGTSINLIDRILGSGDIGDVTGSLEGRWPWRPLSDDESGLIADIGELENILTAENLDMMSGTLSDTDIAIIRQTAGGALNRTRSKDEFVRRVSELKTILKKYQDMQRPSGEQKPLAVGDVRKGYRYLGGNPNAKTSWEKI